MSSCIVHHWFLSIQISIIKITVISHFPFCLLGVFLALFVVKTPFRNSPEAGWLWAARGVGGHGQCPSPLSPTRARYEPCRGPNQPSGHKGMLGRSSGTAALPDFAALAWAHSQNGDTYNHMAELMLLIPSSARLSLSLPCTPSPSLPFPLLKLFSSARLLSISPRRIAQPHREM